MTNIFFQKLMSKPIIFLCLGLLYDNNSQFSEAYSQPFSISGAEPVEESVDAYDIVQAVQEVQLQAHGVKSTPVDTTG